MCLSCFRALWSPAGKGLTSWLSFVMFNCVSVTFPSGILSQVWYLIVSFPDLCQRSYFHYYIQEHRVSLSTNVYTSLIKFHQKWQYLLRVVLLTTIRAGFCQYTLKGLARSVTMNIFRKNSFTFISFVKIELSYVFTINLFSTAENCTEK